MEIKSVAVIGTGLMGRQIGLNSALYGIPAKVYDNKPEVCDDVEKWAEKYLSDRVKKGKLTEEAAESARNNFKVERDLAEAVKDVDCVIEAIYEDLEVKRAFFRELDKLIGPDVLVATNSSFMVSSKFADCISNPSRLANMHYYNPALLMKFVEIVQGPHTAPETAEAMYNYCKAVGKRPIWQKKEIDGFAGNYLFAGLKERAHFLVENGYCTYEDVDIAMEEGFRHPMGPFRTSDFVGIDLSFAVMDREYKETGKKPDMYDTYKKMVEEGKLGVKSGEGFYKYK